MKVTCSKCGTEYNFDDAKVTDEGVKVKCTRCDNVFKVRKKSFVLTEPIQGVGEPITTPSPAADKEPSQPSVAPGSKRKWTIRKPAGDQLEFDEMTTLQRWIVEKKVSADDEISHNGVKWKRLGTIVELDLFFRAAEGSQPSLPAQELTNPSKPAKEREGRPAGLMMGLLALVGLFGAWSHFTTTGQEFTRPARAWIADNTGIKIGSEYYAAATPTPGEIIEIVDATPTQTSVAISTPVSTATVAATVEPTPVTPASPAPTKVAVALSVDQLLQKGYEAYSRGRYREAIAKYQAAINAAPDNSEAYALLGLAYLDAGNDDLAESSLEASIRLNPRFADAHRYLGLLYSKRNDKPRAIQSFTTYLDLRPNGPTSDDVRRRVASLQGS